MNTCSNSTVETLEEGVVCSKLIITTTERWHHSPLVYITEFPANIYLFKVNKIKTKMSCEICLTLTVNTPEPSQ